MRSIVCELDIKGARCERKPGVSGCNLLCNLTNLILELIKVPVVVDWLLVETW
jgi:hypothetical protein